MNKRRLHHYWRYVRFLKPWHCLVAAILLTVVCVNSLRTNYEHMVTLRTAVYTADQNNGDITTALNNLRHYVNNHMNTDLATSDSVYPPIQLKYTYDRLVQQQSQQVAATNSQVYGAAQAYCEKQDPVDFSGHNRVPCIEQYVTTHGAAVQTIPDDLYKFSFASPTWSPDLAGWSMVGAVLSGVVGIVQFIIKRLFKRHQ